MVKVKTRGDKHIKIEYSNFHSSKQQSDGSLRRDNDLIESEYAELAFVVQIPLKFGKPSIDKKTVLLLTGTILLDRSLLSGKLMKQMSIWLKL